MMNSSVVAEFYCRMKLMILKINGKASILCLNVFYVRQRFKAIRAFGHSSMFILKQLTCLAQI